MQIHTPGNNHPAPKRAYSVAEVAQQKGISPSHLRDLIREGAGPAIIRLGKRVVITDDALEAWETALQQQQQAA
jgi:excisionase family DNA binding protein